MGSIPWRCVKHCCGSTYSANFAVVVVQLHVLPKAMVAGPTPLFVNKWYGDLATSLV